MERRLPDVTARITSLLADLRAARAAAGYPPHGTNGETDTLVEMLMNPDFLPPSLRGEREVRNHPPAAYDDLPPLEDDSAPTLPSTRNASRSNLPPLEGSYPSSEANSVPAVDAVATPTPSHHPSSVLPADSSARATMNSSRSRSARGAAPNEDDGAESDGSLPSLQSVSDSSDEEEDDYVSESDSGWDDDESLDESEEEASIARMIEDEAPRNPNATGTNAEPTPESHFERFTLQSYRDLLERAVSKWERFFRCFALIVET